MIKPFHLAFITLACAAWALGQAPTIIAVENSATNAPPGLPNGAVAQGSLFVVKGTNLGPATVVVAQTFPLQTSIGGTSATVTVGGTTVNVIMYYSLASQIAGILPSSTPTGTGTIKITYQGQSVTGPITVVQNNIGIFTVSQTGNGDAIAFVNTDNGLITPTHAANPNDVIVFWGTGLGPVTFDETKAAVQTNMTNVPLKVYIGGQQVTVLFAGRNACCSSVDVVYVAVPSGVSGCSVPVIMQINNLVSNATTIAVATDGTRTCTPTNPSVTLTGQGTFSTGGLVLSRSVAVSAGIGGIGGTTTKSDSISGSFIKITPAPVSTLGSLLDIPAYGSCLVAQYNGLSFPQTPQAPTVQYLDAGPSIAMSAPFGSKTIAKSSANGVISYSLILDQTATTLVAGAYSFTGPGGADVGPFSVNFNNPAPLNWTPPSTITRANGATISWTGGDPNGYLTITGTSTYIGDSQANSGSVTFLCTARVSAGSFTVPPPVLLALPPSSALSGTAIVLPGTLSLGTTSLSATFQATGLSLGGGVVSTFSSSSSVVYQ